MLRRIVFSPFDFVTLAAADPELDGFWADDDPAPFLVLYQHGKSVWAGPPETQACKLPLGLLTAALARFSCAGPLSLH